MLHSARKPTGTRRRPGILMGYAACSLNTTIYSTPAHYTYRIDGLPLSYISLSVEHYRRDGVDLELRCAF